MQLKSNTMNGKIFVFDINTRKSFLLKCFFALLYKEPQAFAIKIDCLELSFMFSYNRLISLTILTAFEKCFSSIFEVNAYKHFLAKEKKHYDESLHY